jgi:catechol 2,3-dioxygenase
MVEQASQVAAEALERRVVIKPLFHHLLLKTKKLEEMKAWYATVAGLAVQFEFSQGAFLYNDAANHRVVLFSTEKMIEDDDKFVHTGLDHLAFEYDCLEDLLASYARLSEEGIEPFMTLDHGLTTSFYYSDPDGNGVELQCDNFGDWALSSAFMRNDPEFAQNPIGAHVDPEQLIAAVREGVSREEIRRRSWAGEYTPAHPGAPRFPL